MEKSTHNYLMIDPTRSGNTIIIGVSDIVEASKKYLISINKSKKQELKKLYKTNKPITFSKLKKLLPNWAGLYEIIEPVKFIGNSDSFKGELTISYEDMLFSLGTKNTKYKILC